MSTSGSGELTKRWAVAGVGVPAVLGLLYVGGWVLAVPVAAFAALGAREMERLAAPRFRLLRGMAPLAAAAFVLAAALHRTFEAFAPPALGVVTVLTLGSGAVALARRRPDQHPLEAVGVTVFAALYAGLALAFVPLLHALPTVRGWTLPSGDPWAGLAVVALPLASTWIGDAAAFFAGRRWGRRKIFPSVSPGKSWVGSAAGLLGAAVAAAIWLLVVQARLPGLPVGSVGGAALLGAALGLGAQAGDFVESLFKREAGVKDSGTLFPGHGGVLDRLDALLYTAPLAYGALVLLEAMG